MRRLGAAVGPSMRFSCVMYLSVTNVDTQPRLHPRIRSRRQWANCTRISNSHSSGLSLSHLFQYLVESRQQCGTAGRNTPPQRAPQLDLHSRHCTTSHAMLSCDPRRLCDHTFLCHGSCGAHDGTRLHLVLLIVLTAHDLLDLTPAKGKQIEDHTLPPSLAAAAATADHTRSQNERLRDFHSAARATPNPPRPT